MTERLDAATAATFARVALANVARPFPHKLDRLLVAEPDAVDAADHVARHPVFFGSYDWHSSVHMHWLLARLLRLHPDSDCAGAIAALFAARLAPAPLAREQAAFAGAAGRTFERPYGWAWLLELRAEIERVRRADPRATAWGAALDPLARDLAARLAAFVRAAPHPIRAGTHANTAFAALLGLDYAATCGAPDLAAALADSALRWHAADRDAPLHWEPSLTDFLSPTLAVAALLAALVPAGEFAGWLDRFLPAGLGPLATPPRASDPHDPQIVHLDGLCLSRAWLFERVARGLPPDHPLRDPCARAAAAHRAAGLPRAVGGDYVGEHWLPSFAALALGDVP